MTKDTVINPTLTPANKVDFTEGVLGKVVDIQTRWSPGSLASQLIGASEQKVAVVFTATQLVGMVTSAAFLAALQGSAAVVASWTATPIGSERSRAIDLVRIPGGAYSVIAPSVEDGNLTPVGSEDFVFSLLGPVRPTFTVLSLLNKFEDFALSNGGGYLIGVDQESGKAFYLSFATSADADAALAVLAGDFDVLSAFLMTGSAAASNGSVFNWE